MNQINYTAGMKVKSRLPQGIALAAVPTNGQPDQKRATLGVFKSGRVIRTKLVAVNYQQWAVCEGNLITNFRINGSGFEYVDVLVESTDGKRVGWIGAGALMEDKPIIRGIFNGRRSEQGAGTEE